MGSSASKECPPKVAIEIGSVNSGYVYHLGGKTVEIFTATYGYGLPENRVPTALLLNSDGAFDSFGTAAKDKFYALALKDKQHEYKYFDKSTFCESSSAHSTTYASNEDSVFREEIFAQVIKYLYEKCSNIVKSDGQSMQLFVFTVSGTNFETESKFMRSAASKGGIPEKQIIFLREIDAAAFYCTRQCLVVTQSADTEKLSPGSRFIVVNLGGSKTQYCTFEVKQNDHVKPLSDVESLPFGGETVTESFLRKIESLVGNDKWNSFKDKNRCSYVDIKRSFENCKRTFDSSTQGYVIEMPPAFMQMVDSKIKQQSESGICFAEDNKMIIERETLLSFFDESLQEIVTKLKTSDHEDTDIILLVGGFAKSSYAREFITNEMKPNSVVLVPNPDLAVLKGAVMLKKPCLRSPCTYGFIIANTNCQEYTSGGNHSNKNMYEIISKNEIVYTNQVFKKKYSMRRWDSNTNIHFCKTDNKDTEELRENIKPVMTISALQCEWLPYGEVEVELRVTVEETNLEFTPSWKLHY